MYLQCVNRKAGLLKYQDQIKHVQPYSLKVTTLSMIIGAYMMLKEM